VELRLHSIFSKPAGASAEHISQEFIRTFGKLRELHKNGCYYLAAMTDEELIAVAAKLVGEFRTSEDCTPSA